MKAPDRDQTIRIPVMTGDVSSGYLLSKWSGLSAYDDVAGCVTLLTQHAEQLRNKDETILALADSLECMTHTATGLHLLYRLTAKSESDGSHEKAFADALALVNKARTT